MNQEDERINAQLTSYFQKVISNSAINYYKKKRRIVEKEVLTDTNVENYESVIEDTFDSFFTKVVIFNVPFYIDNEAILDVIDTIKENEKYFLVQKFFYEKTDKEIGGLLGISRQGVTNLKHRLYSKFRKKI